MATAETQKAFDIPKKYKAIVYDKPGTISTKIEELDTPEPGAGDVLIRLCVLYEEFAWGMLADRVPSRTHSGVCHSDMGIMENTWRGRKKELSPGRNVGN
jgi:alcohol dehydrogenase, propanol-preferring